MIAKRFYLSLAAAMLLTASCSQEELAENHDMGDGLAKATTSSFMPFEEEGETRSVLDLSGPSITFKWATGDKLAIYSGGQASGMTNFNLVDGINSEVATFKANGFLLTEGAQYYAFTPYNGNQTNKTRVAVDYNGQVQTANGSYDQLNAKDYQYSEATTATSKNPGKLTNFNLKHLGAICRFQLTMPEDAVVTEFTLSGTGLASKGLLDLTTGTFTSEEGSLSMSLGTSGAGISVASGKVLTLYMMLPQQDLSACTNFTATLTATGGKTYTAKLIGKNIVGGRAYGWVASVYQPGFYKGHACVEIGGKKWATMNLGATTVAGSYATCVGDFYIWGETTPRYTGITWSGSTASFNGWKSGFSGGYNTYPSYTGSTLDAAHDAVASHADWGEGWRMPTSQDFKDLYVACGGTGTRIYGEFQKGNTSTTDKGIYWCGDYDGVAGLLFCDGTNKLFFPASGYVEYTSHEKGGLFGRYWSSSFNDADYAYGLGFSSSEVSPSTYHFRHRGLAVRPVSD